MKSSFCMKALAFTPVAVATFTCAWLADAQDAPAQAEVSPSAVVQDVATAVVDVTAVSATEPLQTQLQPVSEWPEAGKASDFALLEYVGVNQEAKNLLAEKYEKWLGYMDSRTDSKTLPQNLLQSSGCVEPCDMNKALLFVDTESKKVFVAMVEDGHVLMRPSLMSWPDEAIAPLKKWLAANESDSGKSE